MTVYLLVFAGALVLAIGGTPLARRLAPRLQMMDQPSARKVHHHPVPRLGGMAIYLAVLATVLILGERYNFTQFGSIVIGATGVSFLGLVDDRWGLRPTVKLMGQILAALLLWATGIRVGTFHQPLLDLIVTLLWVVYITNAINLLDNMDGLAGGVSAIAAAYFALMCAFSGQYLVGALAAAVLGACLGFLFYNLNPASIFMGDSGALFLGFTLAALGIKLRFPDNVTFVTWMVPVLVMGLPVFDTALVTLSRVRRGLNPLTHPGKDHVSHRLVAAGMTPREAVLTLYVVSFTLGLLAVFVTRASVMEGYTVGGLAFLVGLYALWRFERSPFFQQPATSNQQPAMSNQQPEITTPSLQDRIANRSARIAVIGLGYVGLPLALAFARAGFSVIGVDVDERKVSAINAGRSTIGDVSDEELRSAVEAGLLHATTDYGRLSQANAIFICVPTPYDAQRAPDLSYIRAAAEGIRLHLRPGQLVILQSTTYPGTTEEIVQPILESTGLRAGADFHLAFSPERIDPGNREWSAYNTPKVVGGVTPECTRLACDLLSQMGAPVHPVSSPRAAEMTKLLENIFRSVNIALVNELAVLAERMGIDFWEVIEAAKTKPFGFMPFYPGAGVGGHCIPVDPYYLSWKAREYDFYTKFIELAAEVNQAMPYHAVDLVTEALSRQQRPLREARILVLGVAFKPDVEDPRNSPAERIIELLLARGAQVRYHDPYVPCFSVGGDVFYNSRVTLESIPLKDEELTTADCVLIVTGHHCLDYNQIARKARLVVDCCNATRSATGGSARIVRLGAPLSKESL